MLIAIDLSKQQKLDAYPKPIQKISFTGNSGKRCNKIFHYQSHARNSFRFFKRNSKSIMIFFFFNVISKYHMTQ